MVNGDGGSVDELKTAEEPGSPSRGMETRERGNQRSTVRIGSSKLAQIEEIFQTWMPFVDSDRFLCGCLMLHCSLSVFPLVWKTLLRPLFHALVTIFQALETYLRSTVADLLSDPTATVLIVIERLSSSANDLVSSIEFSWISIAWFLAFIALASLFFTQSAAVLDSQQEWKDEEWVRKYKSKSTTTRVRQQEVLLQEAAPHGLPTLSTHETRLQVCGILIYLMWAWCFANLPQHLCHILIILHILFNSRGRWASLSSTFKYDGNKIYPVALLFGFRFFGVLSDSLHYEYTSSALGAALRILIFLHETDSKLGNLTHMLFVYGSILVDLVHAIRSGSFLSAELAWSILCGFVYVLCDRWTKLQQDRMRSLIHAAFKETTGTQQAPDRDAEYLEVKHAIDQQPPVRLYFNISHYTVHRTFSSVSVLCELVLLSSALC